MRLSGVRPSHRTNPPTTSSRPSPKHLARSRRRRRALRWHRSQRRQRRPGPRRAHPQRPQDNGGRSDIQPTALPCRHHRDQPDHSARLPSPSRRWKLPPSATAGLAHPQRHRTKLQRPARKSPNWRRSKRRFRCRGLQRPLQPATHSLRKRPTAERRRLLSKTASTRGRPSLPRARLQRMPKRGSTRENPTHLPIGADRRRQRGQRRTLANPRRHPRASRQWAAPR
mmetsp:Transcript_12188/g.36678  ORF Transcript_12188/g.36678 Transcript_12188/m.36678 type:complete len:226 (+) Transcript_12188:1139-1816(+)